MSIWHPRIASPIPAPRPSPPLPSPPAPMKTGRPHRPENKVNATRQIVESLPQIVESLPQIVESLPQIVEALPQIVEALPQIVEALPQIVEALPQIVEALPQIVEALRQIVEALRQIVEALRQIVEALRQSVESLRQIVESLRQSVGSLGQSLERLIRSLKRLPQSLEELEQSLERLRQSTRPLLQSLKSMFKKLLAQRRKDAKKEAFIRESLRLCAFARISSGTFSTCFKRLRQSTRPLLQSPKSMLKKLLAQRRKDAKEGAFIWESLRLCAFARVSSGAFYTVSKSVYRKSLLRAKGPPPYQPGASPHERRNLEKRAESPFHRCAPGGQEAKLSPLGSAFPPFLRNR